MGFYFHNVPGRLRVKSVYVKRNERKIIDIMNKLSVMEGVLNVQANPLTGSFVVNYDKNMQNEKEILKFFEREGVFDSSKAVDTDRYLENMASKAGEVIGKTLFSPFVGRALDGTPLAFLSLVL
jgi:hypothetical protein